MTANDKRVFRQKIWRAGITYGRPQLPWRATYDPYHILVSEMMLQQTQVDRVTPKFLAFIKSLPTLKALAEAPLIEVISLWQGLGYNRRARFLQAAAQAVMSIYGGKMPESVKALEALPGVGPYTARAILVFAFNQPEVLIETNIRSLYIHYFFHDSIQVTDKQLLPLIEESLPRDRPRKWYGALMDYGSYLKQTQGNASRQSATYKKQTRFEGSDRELRGKIIRVLLSDSPVTVAKLRLATVTASPKQRTRALETLLKDGLIKKQRGNYCLAT